MEQGGFHDGSVLSPEAPEATAPAMNEDTKGEVPRERGCSGAGTGLSTGVPAQRGVSPLAGSGLPQPLSLAVFRTRDSMSSSPSMMGGFRETLETALNDTADTEPDLELTNTVALWLSLAPLPLLLVLAVASCIQGAYPLTAPHLAAALLLVSYKAASSICETPHVYASRALLGVFAVYCLVFDWVAEGEVGAWVGCVLVANVFGLLRHHTLMKVCVAVLLLYLALKGVEELLGESFVRAKPSEHYAGIGVGWALQNFVCRAGVGVGCVVFTYAIAKAVRDELLEAKRMLRTANLAAHTLGNFQLTAAEYFVNKLPDEALHADFSTLVDNLRQYRTFLPDYFLAHDSDSEAGDGMASPLSSQKFPAPHGRVAMVFTDIESSTRLWEMSPYSMKEALNLHNITTRRVMARFKGYEVKTLGDAFMVAFDSVLSAVSFCLITQQKLFSCEWPPEILAFAECSTVKGAWCGLRVRMGVHVGDVEREENPVTGRVDYFGVTVNKAARVQGVAQGGAITITDEVLAELRQQDAFPSLGQPELIDLGQRQLRGIKDTCHVYYLLPASLGSRRASLTDSASVPTPTARRDDSSLSTRKTKQHKTRLRIGKSVTVADVLVDYSQLGETDAPVQLDVLVATAVDTVSRFEGWVISIGSTGIYCSWNTYKKCVSHLHNAVRAVVQMKQLYTDTIWDGRVWVGLSTGGVMHGHIGHLDEKYYMLIGSCMDWCKMAATAARKLDVPCLHAAMEKCCSIAQDTALKNFVRPVDEWTADSECEKVVRVEQVNTAGVGSGSWALTETPTDWTWTDTYRKAFTERDIAKLSTSSDPVVKHVVLNLREEGHLLRPVTPGYSVPSVSSGKLSSASVKSYSTCSSVHSRRAGARLLEVTP